VKLLRLVPIEVQQNEGNLARDYLANERTFLAWYRTSLAIVALGALVWRVNLLRRNTLSGAIIFGFGMLLLVYSAVRYYMIRRLLDRDLFRSNVWGVAMLCFLTYVVALAVVLLNINY